MNDYKSILRRKDVVRRTGLSVSTIKRYVKSGNFPLPIALGVRSVGWYDLDITNWIESRQQVGC